MNVYEIYATNECRSYGCYTAATDKDALRLFTEAYGFNGKFRKQKGEWHFCEQYGTEYYARCCGPVWF